MAKHSHSIDVKDSDGNVVKRFSAYCDSEHFVPKLAEWIDELLCTEWDLVQCFSCKRYLPAHLTTECKFAPDGEPNCDEYVPQCDDCLHLRHTATTIGRDGK